MNLNLATGIYTRWGDASLDSSIDSLYWGETAPEGDVLPRAVYEIAGDDNSAQSKGSLIHASRLRFRTWAGTPELVSGYNDSIQAAFHNSHKAGTSPLSMTSGTIASCLYAASVVTQEDEEAYMGVIEFDIQWQETNAIPS